MESKIIEYGIILSDKYKAKQIEVIPRLLFKFFTHKLQEHLVRTFTFFQYIFILISQSRYHEFRKDSSYHILKI